MRQIKAMNRKRIEKDFCRDKKISHSTMRSRSIPIASYADSVLNLVLRTRLQRKAKSIIMSGLEFIAADLTVLFTAMDLERNKVVELTIILAIIGAAYIMMLIISISIHICL